ncbi:MAG: type VI secretion protein [Sphingomonadales bacterium RIFCSPLOWO2_12_FULL_63_15]|nr:MAG: type VI secretion protein [Sphingomonadales bacterium RIFCSPLOWO2_12_FULL_63_15]
MSRDDNEFRVRPGRSRDSGAASGRRSQKLAAQVQRAANKAGHAGSRRAGLKRGSGSGKAARGRRTVAAMRRTPGQRRVTVMARIARHKGAHYRAAPLAKHITYLERDGVSRDGGDASMFDARTDRADRDAFAGRCEDDRHHFRFIVSPEDAGDMEDLRSFTRELMADAAKDLGTELDWVAVDHWNTDNPHIHVLVRGVASDGTDLVIDRGYISEGLRFRAEERVTLELGPRTELDIRTALEREVDAERWTSLDRQLERLGQDTAGLVDLRPGGDADPEMRRLLLGRAAKLEQLGLAAREGPAVWALEPGAENTLRDLSVRNDIIKTMHNAMGRDGGRFDVSALALHHDVPSEPIIGRLVERGLHDELTGSAYAIVDGVDGRTHHLRFKDMEMTGDAKAGSIVELRSWEDAKGHDRLSLATRSDIPLEAQIKAPGATWLDRQLVARDPVATGNGFGREVRDALDARASHLETQGLARRQGQRIILAQDLVETLKNQELTAATQAIAARTGLEHKPSGAGDYVSGIYRERVTLSTGRFAMIDEGLGFQLVPWRPALDQHLGQHITGTMSPGGSVDWALGRGRGISL